MKNLFISTFAVFVVLVTAFVILIVYLNFFSPSERLFTAITKNDPESVHTLLDKGVDPNCKSEILRTPLTQAAFSGRFEIVKLLLNKGADCNVVDGSGYSALMYACQGRDTKMAKLLLLKGCDKNLTNHFGGTAITIAKESRAEKILTLLAPHAVLPTETKAEEAGK